MNVLAGDPFAAADVEPQEVRVQLFALRDKMTHVNGTHCASEYSNDVKVSRQGQDPLRFRQGPGEDCLQHDAADESDESERLPDAGEQFCAIEILCCPGGAVLSIQPSGEGCTG